MPNIKHLNKSGVQTRMQDLNDGTYAETVAVAGNISTKFRDAFEVYTPGVNWRESKASGDLVFVDGNAASASYLTISKDPWSAGTETSIESILTFGMPIEVAVGLSMSQRTLGQEFSIEAVDTGAALPDVADIAIAAIAIVGHRAGRR